MTPSADTTDRVEVGEPLPERVDYLVLGAGPGGLQIGAFLQQAGRDYLIVDKADRPGAFFATFPRHRKLISINKRHNYFEEAEFNQRHDWNSLLSDDPALEFTRYSDELFPSADSMCDYLVDFAEQSGLNIRYGQEVVRIAAGEAGGFRLQLGSGRHIDCLVLLLATGAVAERQPDIDGIEHVTTYGTHDLDLERYRNKRVGILGQGNAAFETAEHLSGVAAFVHVLAKEPIRFAWNTHFPGDVRATNNDILDMFQLKSLHAVLAPRIVRIDRVGDVLRTTHEYDYPEGAKPGTLQLTRDYDQIISCTGFDWVPTDLFSDDIRPDSWHEGKFPSLTPTWESTNVSDLFFVGGSMQGNDRASASGFIHGFRYNIRTLARLLEERYEGVPYPTTVREPFDWDFLAEHLYHRLSVSAGLFQLYGTLCDVVVVEPDHSRMTILAELPLTHAATLDFSDAFVFFISLEFGFDQYSEPAVSFFGPSDPMNTDAAAFLHPVVRARRSGVETGRFHFGDSLLGRWDLPHATGGAVMPYHEEFRRWVHAHLQIELSESPAEPAGAYRIWEDGERARWVSVNRVDHVSPPFRNALSTAQGLQSGADGRT